MRRAIALLGAGFVAVALAGSLSAGTTAESRLTITTVGKLAKGKGAGTFKLVGSNAAYTDSGRFTYPKPVESLPLKTPEGMAYVDIKRTETLKGKHGTLVIRSVLSRFEVAKEDDFVSTGTWSIVKGTGRYAGLKGGGTLVGLTQFATNASNFSDYVISARYEGLTQTG